jgi:hypothetical protein
LLLLLLAAPVSAAPKHVVRADTLGLGLRLGRVLEVPDLPYPGSSGLAQVHDRFDLVWFWVGLVQQGAVAWPKDRLPVLYSGAERVAPVRAFAVGGPPGFIPHSLTWIEPDEMFRRDFPATHELCTVIFAGYPRGHWDPAKVDRVRLERRDGGSP